MKHITSIEDLPTEELRERARQLLLIYGNVFIYQSESMGDPVVLSPKDMMIIRAKAPEQVYGEPRWLPHIADIAALAEKGGVFKNYVTGEAVDVDGNRVHAGVEVPEADYDTTKLPLYPEVREFDEEEAAQRFLEADLMGRDPRMQAMMHRELAACAGQDMSEEEALRELGYITEESEDGET